MLALSPFLIPALMILSIPVLLVGGAFALRATLRGGKSKVAQYGSTQREVRIDGPKDGPYMIKIIDMETGKVLEWEKWHEDFADGWLRAMEMYEDSEATRGPPNPYP